jgi:CPA1 family monovalent cation:H+ antiporter
VLGVRVAIVYPIAAIVNRLQRRQVSLSYQHVMVWGALHGSIPIALVLGLPPGFPQATKLRAMVFGVAAFSLVVQGLTMPGLMNRLGIATRSDVKNLYQILIGRARAVDAALEAADRLESAGDLPRDVHTDFTAEYEREKEDLSEGISRLLRENPELRREELLVGERRVFQEEKSAIMDATRRGVVSDDIADRLLEEADVKLDLVNDGESTVEQLEEGYEEFWRSQAAEFGIDFEVETADAEANAGDDDDESTHLFLSGLLARSLRSLAAGTAPRKICSKKPLSRAYGARSRGTARSLRSLADATISTSNGERVLSGTRKW